MVDPISLPGCFQAAAGQSPKQPAPGPAVNGGHGGPSSLGESVTLVGVWREDKTKQKHRSRWSDMANLFQCNLDFITGVDCTEGFQVRQGG